MGKWGVIYPFNSWRVGGGGWPVKMYPSHFSTEKIMSELISCWQCWQIQYTVAIIHNLVKISQNGIKILNIGLVGRKLSLTSYQNLYVKSCTRLYIQNAVCVCAHKSVGECVICACVYVVLWCVWMCECGSPWEVSSPECDHPPFLTSRNEFTPTDVEHYYKHEHDGVLGLMLDNTPRDLPIMFPWNTCHFVEGESIYKMRDGLLFWLHAGRFEWWVKRKMKRGGDTLRIGKGQWTGSQSEKNSKGLFFFKENVCIARW